MNFLDKFKMVGSMMPKSSDWVTNYLPMGMGRRLSAGAMKAFQPGRMAEDIRNFHIDRLAGNAIQKVKEAEQRFIQRELAARRMRMNEQLQPKITDQGLIQKFLANKYRQ